jgi:hypothetical protein
MRRSPFLLVPAIALALVVAPACSRQVPPPPAPAPAPAAPVTGWTTTNSQYVARVLMDAATSHAWVAAFRQAKGRMPVIEVGTLDDRTADNLPLEDIQAEFGRVLAASDRVLSAAQGQVADATLSGAIKLITAGPERKLYQVDLRIRDQSGDCLLYTSDAADDM